jgi:uncharacterized protein YndB with AHSA1/START domain
MNSIAIQLHRVFRASPEKVYRAFIDPAAMVKWLPPDGFTGTIHEMKAEVGGGYTMSFTNFGTGQSHRFSAIFTEMVPGERLVHTDRFDDPNLAGEMKVTIEFKAVSCGTDLRVTQEGIPAAIPTDACYHGWGESMELLTRLVEHSTPDEV